MGTLTSSLVLGLTLATITSPVWAKREKPLTAVADLRYGVALYDYYSDDYFDALTELLVAKEKGGIKGHGVNPDIMEGGLALGYGMEYYASDIFERLLKENRSVDTQDRAWFYIAKLRYDNGDWDRAHEALAHLSKKPPEDIVENVNALKLNLFIRQDRIADAEKLLDDYEFSNAWLPYIHFNLGSAYARHRDYDKAIAYFTLFSRNVYKSETNRALYDKALTAAGYCYLFQKKYPQAMEQFSRVRLSSKLSNRALLGYGWAASETGNYQEALKPWLRLTKSTLIDENNQEALIAVPYAYEKLGNTGLALNHYQTAEESYVQEIGKIYSVINTLRNEELTTALNLQVSSEGMNWLNFAKENQLSPHITYLIELFSKDKFQVSVKELKDLLALKQNLLGWQQKINLYTAMIKQRQSNRLAKAEYLQVSKLEGKVEEMRKERADLAAKIERVGAEKDYLAMSGGSEAKLVKRVMDVKAIIEKMRGKDPFVDEYEESARRYYGLLLWQASEKFGDRMWTAVKELNQLDDTIKDLNSTRERVQKLMDSAPDLDPYQVKMDNADAEIATHLADIDIMISRQEADLRGKVIAALTEQRSKLMNFLAQSRLAIARIYDQAHQDQEAAAAAAAVQAPSADSKADDTGGDAEPEAATPSAPDQDGGAAQ